MKKYYKHSRLRISSRLCLYAQKSIVFVNRSVFFQGKVVVISHKKPQFFGRENESAVPETLKVIQKLICRTNKSVNIAFDFYGCRAVKINLIE